MKRVPADKHAEQPDREQPGRDQKVRLGRYSPRHLRSSLSSIRAVAGPIRLLLREQQRAVERHIEHDGDRDERDQEPLRRDSGVCRKSDECIADAGDETRLGKARRRSELARGRDPREQSEQPGRNTSGHQHPVELSDLRPGPAGSRIGLVSVGEHHGKRDEHEHTADVDEHVHRGDQSGARDHEQSGDAHE